MPSKLGSSLVAPKGIANMMLAAMVGAIVLVLSIILAYYGQGVLIGAVIAVGGYTFTALWDRQKAGNSQASSRSATLVALTASLEKVQDQLINIDDQRVREGTGSYLHLLLERTGWELLLQSGHISSIDDELVRKVVLLYANLDAINEYARIYDEYREDIDDLAEEASRLYGQTVHDVLPEIREVLTALRKTMVR